MVSEMPILVESEKRSKIRSQYRALIGKIIGSDLPQSERSELENDLHEAEVLDYLDADIDVALVSWEELHNDRDLHAAKFAFGQGRNEEFKVVLAERIDPVGHIESMYEVLNDPSQGDQEWREGEYEIQVKATRKNLQEMIKASSGDVRSKLEAKLAAFEGYVESVEIS